MAQNESNSGLYFAVGALLVAVVVLGLLFINDETMNTQAPDTLITTTEPASGNNTDTDRTDFDLQVDEEGFSASSTNREEN